MNLSSILHRQRHLVNVPSLRQPRLPAGLRRGWSALLLGALLCLGLGAGPANAAPLSGTKSVGPTGDYTSIGAAIVDIQMQTLGGALVLELQPAYLGTVETFPLTVPALTGASAMNTLTIRPASGATALSLSSAGTTTVDLNGAQFVTIDGRPGGVGSNAGSGGGAASQLTIANTSASGVALRLINEAGGNTITYTTLRGVNTSTNSGTVVFSTTTGANGNDNNTIDHCDIGDGASTPANGIYAAGSTGTTAQNNSGNTVSNCNIFNFYAALVDAAGVRLDAGNTDWTLTGNSFYQTATRAAAGTSSVPVNTQAIYVNNASGNNFTVTGNFIGGDSPGAAVTTQKWTTTGTTVLNYFQGIRLNVGTITPSSVQGNTIRNFVWTLSAGGSAWLGIHVEAGSVNIGTATGNTIGSGTGTGSVSVTYASNGTSTGISSASSGTVAIVGNAIGSITVATSINSGRASVVGIDVTAGANTISNNTVGSTTTANSINSSTAATPTAGGVFSFQFVVGIQSRSPTSAIITGNTVANLNNNYKGVTSSEGDLTCGICTRAGLNTITGNTVRNISGARRDRYSDVAVIAGIFHRVTSSLVAGQTIAQNTVHSIASSAAAGNSSPTGIYFYGGATDGHDISRNLVHSITGANTLPNISPIGMMFVAGDFKAQNNIVCVGFDASGASEISAGSLYGIYDYSVSEGRNFYHNSVYVGGTQTSGAGNSYAFYSTGVSNARTYKNNIFVNARSRSGTATGKHYAVTYGGTTVNPTGLMADGNLFLASGTGGVFGFYNGADVTSLAAWRTVTGQDANSLNTDPLFLNPTGDATTVDLHIPVTSPANNAGRPLPAVPADFDGQSRSATTPDIGADEFVAAALTITGATGPSAGSYQAGQSLSFTVNFSAAVTVDTIDGTPTLPLTIGASSVNATYASGSGSTALVFTYTVLAGDTDTDGIASTSPLALNDGSIKAGTTAATLTFTPPTTTTVLVDTTAPTISVGAPSASSTTAGPITYTVTYADAAFNASTLAVGNITLNKTGTANGTVTVDAGTGTTRTVTISSITGAGTLGITIAAGTASDVAGNLAPANSPSTTVSVAQSVDTVQAIVARLAAFLCRTEATNMALYPISAPSIVSNVPPLSSSLVDAEICGIWANAFAPKGVLLNSPNLQLKLLKSIELNIQNFVGTITKDDMKSPSFIAKIKADAERRFSDLLLLLTTPRLKIVPPENGRRSGGRKVGPLDGEAHLDHAGCGVDVFGQPEAGVAGLGQPLSYPPAIDRIGPDQ